MKYSNMKNSTVETETYLVAILIAGLSLTFIFLWKYWVDYSNNKILAHNKTETREKMQEVLLAVKVISESTATKPPSTISGMIVWIINNDPAFFDSSRIPINTETNILLDKWNHEIRLLVEQNQYILRSWGPNGIDDHGLKDDINCQIEISSSQENETADRISNC